MNGDFKVLPLEALEDLKAKYANNPEIVQTLDNYINIKKEEEAQNKIKADFEAKVSKLAKLPTPPSGIYNVYLAWKEVEDSEAEAVQVEVDGKTELRKPKVHKWVIEVNKAMQVSSGKSSGASGQPNKRAISVYKRNGTQLELKGNYANATLACKTLGLTIGGDSANRVLQRNGYVVEAYQGGSEPITEA